MLAGLATLGHIAVGLAAARWDAAQDRPSFRSRFASATFYAGFSLAPDIDVVAHDLGLGREHPFAHRGATHSLAFALVGSLLITLVALWQRAPWKRIGALSFLVLASHGVLDAFTDGGPGAMLFWPLSEHRLFWWFRPLPVAPVGRRLFAISGLLLMAKEALYFAPLFLYAAWPFRRAQ